MEQNIACIRAFASKEQEQKYLRIPFEVDALVERIEVECSYPASRKFSSDGFICVGDKAVIDLAVAAPGGDLVGAAGSDRKSIWISPLGSSAGFDSRPIANGTWEVVAGLYHVPDDGVALDYTITVSHKERRLFKGDTHVHTNASDGEKDIFGVISEARAQGLDFIILTDHNNYAQNSSITKADDLTILPGTEWTHYKGHAGFLGIERPFCSLYCAEDFAEAKAIMEEARSRGAFVALNHPFCPLVPWEWGFDIPFDGVEVWNGVMAERNMKAIYFWNEMLLKGMRVPACGGSDYHKSSLFSSLGTPSMCLYAMSREPADLMDALKRGSGFISYIPNGPGMDIAGSNSKASFGEVALLGEEVQISFFGLTEGDEIRLITDVSIQKIPCPKNSVSLEMSMGFGEAKFMRAEIHRSYAPGLPPMIALVSNPIYFA
jgi:hypothetical protein